MAAASSFQVSSSWGSESAYKHYTRMWLGKRPPGKHHMLDLAVAAGCMFVCVGMVDTV